MSKEYVVRDLPGRIEVREEFDVDRMIESAVGTGVAVGIGGIFGIIFFTLRGSFRNARENPRQFLVAGFALIIMIPIGLFYFVLTFLPADIGKVIGIGILIVVPYLVYRMISSKGSSTI